jgi:hypothetical protein
MSDTLSLTARGKDRRDAVGNGPVKLKLLWREAADPSPPATAHLRAGEADAHVGAPRMAGQSTMRCTPRLRVLHLQKICRRIFPLAACRT